MLTGIAFIGLGFTVGLEKYQELFDSILHSLGILFWSFPAGNGIVWLIFSALSMYLIWDKKKPIYAFLIQTLASFFLGYSMAIGVFMNT